MTKKHAFTCVVFLAALAVFSATAMTSAAAEQAGKTLRVTGRAEASGRADVRPRSLAADAPIFDDDVLRTAAQSMASFRFSDGTLLDMGPSSQATVVEYVDAEKGAGLGTAIFRFGLGLFRAATGKIAKANPARFRVESPLGVIGVRGTGLGFLNTPDVNVAAVLHDGPAYFQDAEFDRQVEIVAGTAVTKRRGVPVEAAAPISQELREMLSRLDLKEGPKTDLTKLLRPYPEEPYGYDDIEGHDPVSAARAPASRTPQGPQNPAGGLGRPGPAVNPSAPGAVGQPTGVTHQTHAADGVPSGLGALEPESVGPTGTPVGKAPQSEVTGFTLAPTEPSGQVSFTLPEEPVNQPASQLLGQRPNFGVSPQNPFSTADPGFTTVSKPGGAVNPLGGTELPSATAPSVTHGDAATGTRRPGGEFSPTLGSSLPDSLSLAPGGSDAPGTQGAPATGAGTGTDSTSSADTGTTSTSTGTTAPDAGSVAPDTGPDATDSSIITRVSDAIPDVPSRRSRAPASLNRGGGFGAPGSMGGSRARGQGSRGGPGAPGGMGGPNGMGGPGGPGGMGGPGARP